MPDLQRQRFCPECQRKTLHAKNYLVSSSVGCLLAVITLGLFIPVWLAFGILDAFRPMRCQRCGRGKLI
jgi:hypothetical protein